MAKSEHGVHINIYEAGSIMGVMQGTRQRYDSKRSLYVNSLFLDFLRENGLKINNAGSTRDIITINFGYGTNDFEYEENRLRRQMVDNESQKNYDFYKGLYDACLENKDKYKKVTAQEIREIFYEQGVVIHYKDKDIKYKMLCRSPGSAKKGSCTFISSRLYKKAHNFLYMGMKFPKHEAKIIEGGAYAALMTSSIVDRITINPKDVLIIHDIDSFFKTDVVNVVQGEDNHLHAQHEHDFTVKNTIFDGESLIEASIFPEWADGFILLRQFFFKSASFPCHIQQFFKDHFGDGYETAMVKDMFGNEHLAKDIKLICTNESCKWLKFSGMTYDLWCDKIFENGCQWGIVKSSHPSAFGTKTRMSYQMVNSLMFDESSVDAILQDTSDYVERLKSDTDFFISYLQRNKSFSNDFEVLCQLYWQDHSFVNSTYFRDRRRAIIDAFCRTARSGKLLQNGGNLTIVGSPYALLMASVGLDIEDDPEFEVEPDAIQVSAEMFEDGQYLAAFRSPQNSGNNILYFHNHRSEVIQKYFELGKYIIAVNMIHTCSQDRANGADQDSDFFYVTDNPVIVAEAKYAYAKLPTIVNSIPTNSKKYDNTLKNYALIDNQIAAQRKNIGISSNYSQCAQSYNYTKQSKEYQDYCCILSVVAQCCIDSAKKSFGIDLTNEIKYIGQQLEIKDNGYPIWWKTVNPNTNNDRLNSKLISPMTYIYKAKFPRNTNEEAAEPMQNFFVKYRLNMDIRIAKHVEKLIEKYSLDVLDFNKTDNYEAVDSILMREDFEVLVEDIRRSTFSNKYIGLFSWLIDRAFIITDSVAVNDEHIKTKLNKNKALLLRVLYEVNPQCLLKCFARKVNKIE